MNGTMAATDAQSILSNPKAGLPVTDRAAAKVSGFDAKEDMLLVRLPAEPEGGGHLRVKRRRDGQADVYLDGLHLARVALAGGNGALATDAVVLMIDPGCTG